MCVAPFAICGIVRACLRAVGNEDAFCNCTRGGGGRCPQGQGGQQGAGRLCTGPVLAVDVGGLGVDMVPCTCRACMHVIWTHSNLTSREYGLVWYGLRCQQAVLWGCGQAPGRLALRYRSVFTVYVVYR